MIVFFSSGSAIPWQLSLALAVLSSILGTPLFGGGFSRVTHLFNEDDQLDLARGQGQRVPEEQVEGLGWGQLVCLLVAVLLGYFFCLFMLQVSRHMQAFGIWFTMKKLWSTPIRAWHTFLAPHRQDNGNDRSRRPTPSHSERFATVTSKIAGLPVETYMSKGALQALGLHDLKDQLQKMGVKLRPGEAIDRDEAIQLATQSGGSSSESCMICCEDYKEQDTLRRLPKCRHCFHLECIDRWLLSTAEYSNRTASCPMCNAQL